MKATALIAAAALVCGTAAFAQQDNTAPRGETATSADSIKPADDAQRTKNAVKNFGHKTRDAMHRAGDKARDMAHNDKAERDSRHARADRYGEKHARTDRHGDRHQERHARAHRDETRSMGAAGDDMRDADASRRQRMDDAYANWKSKQKNG